MAQDDPFGPEFSGLVRLANQPSPEAHWQRFVMRETLVLVGVTGVGKSTTLEGLREHLKFFLLPDRRLVTDVVMIDALAGGPVKDREQRFAWTAKYRESHPGGMAEALGQLELHTQLPECLVFDGLRGLDEVRFAASRYPKARFVLLDAPDQVRVQRLLGRNDAFDRVESSAGISGDALEQLKNISGVGMVFSPPQLEQLAQLDLPTGELVAKTKIVVTERRNYDPVAAREYLLGLPGERVLYLDTTTHGPNDVAKRIATWVQSE